MIKKPPVTPNKSSDRAARTNFRLSNKYNSRPQSSTPVTSTARPPSARLNVQINARSTAPSGSTLPHAHQEDDELARPSPISAWAGNVVSSSPPPLSSYNAPSNSTHRVGNPPKAVIDGIEREAWEIMTEEQGSESLDLPPDVVSMRVQHTRQITHYKNLLVRAQSASSSSLHDLHIQLHDLERRYKALQEEHSRCETKLQEKDRRSRLENEALRGLQGDKSIKSVLHRSSKDDRVELLGIIAESCHPSDIDAQIKLLKKYKTSKLDILGRLPDALASRVLAELKVSEVLDMRLVCRRYSDICSLPAVWRRLCRQLEWRDWDGEAGLAHLASVQDDEWQPLYKRLWQRECNWNKGHAQRVVALHGHIDYVTSLKLRGDTLISGSYDETIRIWHLPSIAREDYRPIVLPVKAVSCLDYYPAEKVFVVGTHDVGRVQVFRNDPSSGWTAVHTLSGHLHGIRAVAIGEKWLVSAGADKALVVWDWRTGEKVVRFGQQTNICVNIQLVQDYLVAVTVDGGIRVFSIRKREMISQYRLSDLHGNDPAKKSRLKDVGGGTGGFGMINWFEGQGRDMICATRDMILRLEWEEIQESLLDTARPNASMPGYASPRTRTVSMSRTVSAPITPTKASNRQRPVSGQIQSPLKPPPKPLLRPLSVQLSGAAGSLASPSPLKMIRTDSSPSTRTTTISTTSRKLPSRQTAPSSIPEETPTGTDDRLVANFTKPPILKEIVKAPDIERGAVDARRTKVVTSTRFASRSGADRHLYVTVPDHNGLSEMVSVAGAWRDSARALDLQTPGKNPMSLVMDREKFVYGCTDGTIVLVSFA